MKKGSTKSSARTKANSRSRNGIPTTVVIGGKVWRVRLTHGLRKRERAYGLCTPELRLIEIDADQSVKMQLVTYIHEATHAAFPKGVVSDRTEERIIEALDGKLYDAFIKSGLLGKK